MKNLNIKILSLLLLVAFALPTFAQEEKKAEKAEEPKKAEDAKKKDNTGTNPINFTFDYRLINERRKNKQALFSII